MVKHRIHQHILVLPTCEPNSVGTLPPLIEEVPATATKKRTKAIPTSSATAPSAAVEVSGINSSKE